MRETVLILSFIAAIFVLSVMENSPGFFVGALIGMIFSGVRQTPQEH